MKKRDIIFHMIHRAFSRVKKRVKKSERAALKQQTLKEVKANEDNRIDVNRVGQ